MCYIEPEIREDEGEIEAAIKGKLPKVIGYNDIKGDLQMHTKWSDGSNTVEEMALAAKKLNSDVHFSEGGRDLNFNNAGYFEIRNQAK